MHYLLVLTRLGNIGSFLVIAQWLTLILLCVGGGMGLDGQILI
jgi:hypothetical protein